MRMGFLDWTVICARFWCFEEVCAGGCVGGWKCCVGIGEGVLMLVAWWGGSTVLRNGSPFPFFCRKSCYTRLCKYTVRRLRTYHRASEL